MDRTRERGVTELAFTDGDNTRHLKKIVVDDSDSDLIRIFIRAK